MVAFSYLHTHLNLFKYLIQFSPLKGYLRVTFVWKKILGELLRKVIFIKRKKKGINSFMINLFDYDDFRAYLRDWYKSKKATNPKFSYQLLAEKTGIKNKGFIYNIINGKKQLSRANAVKLSMAIGHNRQEAEYFENLVSFNQAKDIKEQKYFFERMCTIKNLRKSRAEAQILREDQYEFYSQWYHATIRSLIDMYGFKDDYKWLAKMVNPPISVKQAMESVKLLERLGLIYLDDKGVYRISNKTLTTNKNIVNIGVHNFHLKCTELAHRAITVFPLSKRNISGLTLGISEKSYKIICEEIEKFQEKIMEIANTDDEADRVYQLNFHFFPVSDRDPERERL